MAVATATIRISEQCRQTPRPTASLVRSPKPTMNPQSIQSNSSEHQYQYLTATTANADANRSTERLARELLDALLERR